MSKENVEEIKKILEDMISSIAQKEGESLEYVSKTLIADGEAKIMFKLNGWPHMLEAKIKEGKIEAWSYSFMCLTCFGVGIHLDDPCDVCAGKGWGVDGGELFLEINRFVCIYYCTYQFQASR